MAGSSEAVQRGASVIAVGDVFADVLDGGAAFAPLTPLLGAADVVFGNCEGVYSDRPAKSPTAKHFGWARRERGSMLGEVPFHVMSLANNHSLDGGYVGLEDTIELLEEQGIAVAGAGPDLDAATRPAIVEAGGVRIAFLGFCSVYPVGYEARANRPGLAPLRVRTSYHDPDPNFWEPGIEPMVTTAPLPEDLERYRGSIAAAAEASDFLVVANHWGYSSLLEVLQEYEIELARDAVDHGADAVVCCHHHCLRGIESYAGRPIYYGLGTLVHHFASISVPREMRAARERRFGRLSSMAADDHLPLFPYRSDARRSGAAVLHIGQDGSCEGGFVPALIREDGSTEPLRADDERATDVVAYVERMSAESGFDTQFRRGEWEGWMLLSAGSGGR